MANVKFLTGTETNLLKKNSDGSYVNPIVEGSLYVTAEKVSGVWVSNLYYDINGQRIKVADTSGKAMYDHMNNNIAQTYIKKITMEGTKYASTDGATLTYTTGDNVETTILLPLASTTKAGTVNTGAQTFAGNKTFMGQVILQGGTDTAAGTANSGALIIGSPTGAHISVDANEIQAKSSGTASAQLHINNDGGITQFGGNVQPKADNTLSLGTEKLRWKTIEAVTINATTFNGALNGNVKGNLDGNAATADKWYTARTITLGEDMQGTVSIDGSKNVTLNAVSYSTSCSSGNKANYPWHRIATTGAVTGSHNDKEMIIAIRHSYDGGGYGVAKIALRTNNVSTGGTASASIRWLYRYNIAKDALKIGLRNTSGNALADLYYKVGTWARCRIYQLQGSRSWTLIASSEVDNTTTTDKLTSKEVYTSVSNGNTLLGAGYTDTIEASDGATVQNANYATTADGAKTDSANNTITTHYLSKIGFDGTTNKATKVVVNLYNGSGAIKTTVDFPTASASQAGAITTGTQTLTGAKTLDTNGSLTIQKTSGFNYSGIETASSDSARHVWFSHATNVGTPVKNDKFKLNPGATDTWATVVANATDKTGSAYSKLIVNVVEGIAARAYADDRGQKISTKYVATMAFSGTGSTVTLTYRDGAGADIGTTNIPVASTSAAGIITNAAQSIGGDKTFHGMIKFPNVATGETKGIQWTMADNDSAKIIAGSTASDSGYLEIQTNDNGNEPIYVRQYSAGTLKRTLTLLNGSGNTIVPGNILPVTHASADTTGQTIGSSSALWKEIYARIFYAYSKFTTPSGLFYANNDGDMYVANNTGLGVAPDSNYALKVTGNTFNNGIVYFGNGTTNYVNNSADARFNTVGINGANTTYRLYVNGNTLNNGIVYFANGTTYYINNSADTRLRYVGVGSLAPSSSYALRIGGNVYLNGIHYFANGTTYYVNNSGVAHFKQLLVNGGNTAYDFSVSGTGYFASNLTVDGDIITKGNFKNPNGVVSFVQNNTIVNATTDWNTLTTPGCYKVQMSAWGDAATYHSPNSAQSNLYSYGLLFVLRGSTSDSENRTLQIYFPHQTSTAHPNYCRMLNGTGWQAWHKFHRGALDLTGGTMTGTINAQHIYPKTDNTYNNGSSTMRWKEIHGYTIYAHTKFQNPAGSFYADSNGRMYVQNGTGLGVAPSTDGTYILKVTGNSLFNGILYFANATTYYINNSGTANLNGLTTNNTTHFKKGIRIGDSATGDTNYICFYGTTGDGPGSFNHTYIGENQWDTTIEASELLLFKGNDMASGTSMTTAVAPGPDRIRMVAAGHLFQTYETAVSGTWTAVCDSTVPKTRFEIFRDGTRTHGTAYFASGSTYFINNSAHGHLATLSLSGDSSDSYSSKGYKLYVGGTAYFKGNVTYGANIYLPKNGQIFAIGTNVTSSLIRVVDNTADAYGNGISIGGGGIVVVGAGESASQLVSTGKTGGDENLYLTADQNIYIEAGGDTIANRRGIQIKTDGTIIPIVAEAAQSVAFNIGTTTNAFQGMYSNWVHVNAKSSGSDGGLTLYGGNPTYSIYMRTTATQGTHGYTTGDWATYFNMNDSTTRGWIFKAGGRFVASISGAGYITANRLSLQRKAGVDYGRVYWYDTAFKTWITYMSDQTAASCPTGGTPSKTTEVTTWALRSLIENNSGYGWIWEACANSSTGTPTARMSLSSNTGRLRVEGNASSTTTQTSQLIVSSALNGGSGNTAIELWRGANSSWQIANDGGVLYIRNNYTTAAQTTYSRNGLIMDYNTGAASLPYLALGQTGRNTSYKLYVNGTSWFNSTVYFSSANYYVNGSGDARFNTVGINGANTGYRLYVNGTSYFTNYLQTTSYFKSTVATGTAPIQVTSTTMNPNLNADYVDGWHKQDILGTYYVTSGTADLSHYWCKIWNATVTTYQYNDIGISIYVQSQYNSKYGLFTWRIRQNGASNSGAYSFSISLQEHFGNISSTDIRLYYDNATGVCEVWVNCQARWGVWNYTVLKKCWRTAQDSTNIGTFYNKDFTTAQTLPTSSYINASYTPFLGNASTATALTTSAGNAGQPVYFGSGKPVAIDWHIGNSGVGEHNANNVNYNFCGYYTSNGPATSLGASTNDGALYAQAYSASWVGQIAQDYRNGGLYVRGKNNGTWQSWYRVLDTRNYTAVLDGRYVNVSGDTMTGQLNATAGLKWNHAYWNPSGNIYCQPTANNQEWSIDVGSASYTGSYFHIWSARNSASILQCYDDNRYVAIPVHLYVGGYNNTSYALSTSSFICQSWIRTTGATGWFNETYGGGWYMQDTTYIRNYNNKQLYINAQLGLDANLRLWNNTRQITRASRSVSWINGRDSALIREDDASGYHAVVMTKTGNGAWCIGNYNTSGWTNYLLFSYTTDANYSAGTNSATTIRFRDNGVVESAMWNDYAEYRQSNCEEAGRVVYELGNDSVEKTYERLMHFAGVVSDTYGYVEGETETAKTPLAVAGRVLVYPYQDRNNYRPGDCVCAAPNGTVDIMTREEVIKYPDRIVGTVSCVPEYETWGVVTPAKVNGRIWIKVK